MRDIKFRAWHEATKRMLGPSCIMDIYFRPDEPLYNIVQPWPVGVHYETPGHACQIEELYEIILMQYTGLKDRNGVEIYEGDICAHNVIITAVYWSAEGGCWCVYDDDLLSNHISVFEVIGNIHQHPELMGGEAS